MGTPACIAAIITIMATEQFRYDCDVFPEDAGFTRDGTLDAERWIEDGWLYQHVRGYGPGPHNGQNDAYRRSLSEFRGVDRFYADWVMETDGSGAEVPRPRRQGYPSLAQTISTTTLLLVETACVSTATT